MVNPSDVTFLGEFTGAWTGTLTYRDYSSGKRISIPSELRARLSPDGRTLLMTTTYPKEPDMVSENELTFDVAGGRYRDREGRDFKAEGLKLFAKNRFGCIVLLGTAEEKNAKVPLRRNVTIRSGRLQIRTETGKPLEFRNEWSYKRVPLASKMLVQ